MRPVVSLRSIVTLAALAALAALMAMVFVVGPGVAPVNIYYVAVTGSDSNPCSVRRPCATINHAASLVSAGGKVVVLAGTYTMPATATSSAQSPFYANHVQGTAAAPITIMAQGAVTITRALGLTGTAPDGAQAVPLIEIHDSCNVIVQGFTLIGAKQQPGFHGADASDYYGELEVYNNTHCAGGDDVTFRQNTVLHSAFNCIKSADDEQSVRVIANRLIDCGNPHPPAGQTGSLFHGIYISGPTSLASGNVISGTTGYGIHFHGAVYGGRILNNTVTGAAACGIILDDGPGLIQGNLVYHNTRGICPVDRVDVLNNIIEDNTTDGIHWDYTASAGGGEGSQIIANNTFYHNGAQDIGAGLSAIGPVTITDNIFDGSRRPYYYNSPPWGRSAVIDYNLYFNTPHTPAYAGPHDIVADPRLVGVSITPIASGPTITDVHPRAISPVRGAGVKLGVTTWGDPVDLGALPYRGRVPRSCR